MVDVIVAPYESDAQLTFLTKTKMAQAVVTEDSDLIAFGCEKVGHLLHSSFTRSGSAVLILVLNQSNL